MSALILKSFLETIGMTVAALWVGFIGGVPLAVLLYVTSRGGLAEKPLAHHAVNMIINATRSIPYIILTVLLIPFTRLLTGSSIGTLSAIVPLGISAILLTTRVTEDILKAVPRSLLDLGTVLGATRLQIFTKIIFPEILPNLILGFTMIFVNLTGFSAMAGAVGGGGLGDLAIRYGYQRYDLPLLVVIIAIMILWVQLIQFAGDTLARKFRK